MPNIRRRLSAVFGEKAPDPGTVLICERSVNCGKETAQ
jgi:hypothetical protein